MNLLIDFLKHLSAEKRMRLSSLPSRGKEKEALLYALANADNFSPEKTLKDLQISSQHFRKACSVLLNKCYAVLFPEKGLALLKFLNSNSAWVKHFYFELNRQIKNLDVSSKTKAHEFLRECIALHTATPIMLRDDAAFKKIARKYLSLSSAKSKKEDQFFIAYKEIYLEATILFAANPILDKEPAIGKKIERLQPDFKTARELTIYEYFWTNIYLKHAVMNFEKVIELTEAALKLLHEELNIIMLRLRRAESLYYVSRFDESFEEFRALLRTNVESYPNAGYFYAKYVQVALITGHFEIAKWNLDYKKTKAGNRLEEILPPRDIMSFIKYHLLVGEYETAFKFIRLGFEKNPKAKYLQYEIELRNLETAYFYLSGKEEQAVSSCAKNIKFLRNHGYLVKDNSYPHFFVLIKAFFGKKFSNRKLTKREEEMYARYQKGSYAVYGRILQKIEAS